MEYKDIVIALKELAEQDKGVTLIRSRNDEEFISYRDIWNNGVRIARQLKELGAKPGCEVVVLCRDTKHLMHAFWACMIEGYIAVPLSLSSNEYSSASNDKVYNLLSKPFLLYDETETWQTNKTVFENRRLNLSAFEYGTGYDRVFEEERQTTSMDDITYIQFSSGSTGDPKGAIARKRHICANISDIIKRLEITQEDISLSWQPLTHCYGLIVFHLLPIMLGTGQHLIATSAFAKDPLIWLDKIHQYRATRLGTIPFALKQVTNLAGMVGDEKNWDLSCVKSITIGGEQVTTQLCDAFTETMQRYHLKRDVVLPIYGLAESTTCLSMGRLNRRLANRQVIRGEIEVGAQVESGKQDTYGKVIFCEQGPPLDTVEIRIADEENRSLPEGTIGYIHARGENIVTGYYKNKSATEAGFSSDGWLDTGDIGAVVGENVVVMGRKKELIIVNGKKYNCIDIENLIENKVEKKDFGQVVACNGMDTSSGAEQAIIFVQSDNVSDSPEFIERMRVLTRDIREKVFETAGIAIEAVVPIPELPRTFSGKLRRTVMANMYNQGEFEETLISLTRTKENLPKNATAWTRDKVRGVLVETIHEMLGIRITDYDMVFQSYGIVSSNIPPYIREVNRKFNLNLTVGDFFGNPNINKFSSFILETLDRVQREWTDAVGEMKAEESPKRGSPPKDQIAIVGMSCRLPGGANTIDDYWNVMMSGKDGIVDVPESRWNLEAYYDTDDSAPGKMYCKKGGFLDVPIDEFDARFFNISPKEAAALDPQQRLLLELTWEAFEYGNFDINRFNGSKTGVYLGMSTTEYMLAHLYSGELSKIDAYSLTGTCMSTACGRISYTFGFEGPCMTIDTACSSSLTALHTACGAIKNGDIDFAVVAGINYIASPATNVGFSKLRATSPGGQSKSFDASADGYGRSEGGGAILLKRLSEAEKDNDNILGVISGIGVNQDGKSNGLTAPNGEAQANLIRQTLSSSGLHALDVDYMEMHGTGTPLGDPIEVQAVSETYGQGRSKNMPLKIGSVKSNIGHLEAGAGVASIIKVLLSMKNNVIPANLHFNNPNPLINWEENNVEVVSSHTPWMPMEKPRRAAINGFGFGGSNAHVILEEYKGHMDRGTDAHTGQGLQYALKLSAKDEISLRQYIQNYVKFFENCDEEVFPDLVYSANRGRADFEHRFVVVGRSKDEVIRKMNAYLADGEAEGVFTNDLNEQQYIKNRHCVFMFTGQGSQYINMGKTLYDTNRVFRETMDLCDGMFRPFVLKSLVDLLYGETADGETIAKTVYAQPLIFAIEYSLYKLWQRYGVEPEIVLGHSIGEYVAAVAAGIMSLEDAVKLVSIRGRLMESAPGDGSMGTIFANRETVASMIVPFAKTVSLAAHNAKESCVISGDRKDVEDILESAEKQGIRVQRLKVSHGFHSPLMEPVLKDFMEIAGQVSYHAPKKRLISTLFAREIEEDKVLGADYWTKHIRAEVDYYNSIMSIEEPQQYVFLEVGASWVLGALCRLAFDDEYAVIGSLNRKKEDEVQLAESIASLYAAGVDLDWEQIDFCTKRSWKKTPVPGYPFHRERYWTDLGYDRQGKNNGVAVPEDQNRLLGQRIDSPSMPNCVVFQSKYSAKDPYFMYEHIIFDTAIAPAAAYTSLLISTVKELGNAGSCRIRSMELRSPLAITGKDERLVQICISDMDKDEMQFCIVSREWENPSAEWVTHTVGTLDVLSKYAVLEQPVNFEALKSADIKADAEEGIYTSMMGSGFNLGDGFRRITQTYQENGRGVCLIEPLKTVPNRDMYVMYPGVIDSVFQTMLCLVYKEFNQGESQRNETRAIIPYCFGEISYNYIPSDNLWCDVSAKLDNDVVIGDIKVFNESGELVMNIKDFMAKLTTRNDLLRSLQSAYTSCYHHIDWVRQEEGAGRKNDSSDTRYIVVANSVEKVENLLESLKVFKPILVVSGTKYEKVGDNSYEVNGKEPSHWNKLMMYLEGVMRGAQYKFIYVASDYGISPPGHVDQEGIKDLLFLTQSISHMGLAQKSKIKILTENVQKIGDVPHVNLSGALVWGFAKVLGAEYADMYQGIVDVDSSFFGQNSDRAARELLAENFDEVCLRGCDERYVSRMMIHGEYKKTHREKKGCLAIRGDATYLITGGTGTLGLTYAEFLAAGGAKNIALMCRNKPDQAARERIVKMEAQGVRVELAYADVGQADNVYQALARIRECLPPIRGVVHAAGTLKDAVIADQTWDDFESVLTPKVNGTVNLCNGLAGESLDFFIMMSSITSLVGNVGQSNYAAANYFMNQFAEYLNSRQIPGFSICWGPWEGSGMAMQNEIIRRNMRQMGLEMIKEENAMKMMADFFEHPVSAMLIADVTWNKFLDGTENKVNHNMLSRMVATDEFEVAKAVDKDKSFLDRLDEKDYEEKEQLLLGKLQEISGKVMGFGEGRLPDIYTPFKEQGVDSLMLFSIRSAINKLLSMKLEVSVFFNYPTIQSLARFLAGELWQDEEKDAFESTEDLLTELVGLAQ